MNGSFSSKGNNFDSRCLHILTLRESCIKIKHQDPLLVFNSSASGAHTAKFMGYFELEEQVGSFVMRWAHFEFTLFDYLERLSTSFGMELLKLDFDELDL